MKRIRKLEKKIRHNCPSCQTVYTLLETHLTKKDHSKCPADCGKVWEELLNKHYQEKILGQELKQENEKDHE